MLNIEIKGVQFSNKGAELMLLAILQQLDLHIGEYQITLSPGPNLPYLSRAKLGAWQKLSFRRGSLDLTGHFGKLPKTIKRVLRRYGIITESEIDVILNASGFAYGDQWPASDLRNTAKEISRFKKANKPYIILPQALGPFEKEELKSNALILLRESRLIFARDSQSYLECKKLALDSNLRKSPDFTALVKGEVRAKFIERTICLIPNNKVVSSFNTDEAHLHFQEYIQFWSWTAEIFTSLGFKVLLLNHEGEEDLNLCKQIQALSKSDLILHDGLSAIEIKSLLGQCHGAVSSRFHGCVSSMVQGVPCLATSWSHKYEMLYKEYGLEKNILSFDMSHSDLTVQLTQFVGRLCEQSLQCLEHAHTVEKENELMWESVFKEILM